jgi:hypothetical protein
MYGDIPLAPTARQLQRIISRMELTLDGSFGCFQHERGNDTPV